MHRLHHVDFNVAATVHLAEIARQNFSGTHVRVIRKVKSDLTVFQEFFFGSAFGKHSWPSWLNVIGLGNFILSFLRVLCLDWA